MAAQKEQKEIRLSVRVDEALKKRLAIAASSSQIDEPTIVRNCVAAFCSYVEKHGRSPRFPFDITDQPTNREQLDKPASSNPDMEGHLADAFEKFEKKVEEAVINKAPDILRKLREMQKGIQEKINPSKKTRGTPRKKTTSKDS